MVKTRRVNMDKPTLTEKQQQRLRELRAYMEESRTVQRDDFDKWFAGKKVVCTNVLAWLILIERGE